MTTYKTAELSGPLLDEAVAKAQDWALRHHHFGCECWRDSNDELKAFQYKPSRDWITGGSIVDRERIGLIPQEDGKTWLAKVATSDWIVGGATALEAAMRAYVVAKLGEEVELP